MSNTCGWSSLDPDTQALMDVICTGFQNWCQNTDRWGGAGYPVGDMIASFEDHFDNNTSKIQEIKVDADANYIVLHNAGYGNAALKTAIDAIASTLSTVNTHTAHIGTAFTEVGGGDSYPTLLAHNIATDFANTRTAVVTVGAVVEILKARLGGTAGIVGDLLEHLEAFFLDSGGGQQGITLKDCLDKLTPAPPFTSLSLGFPSTIPQDTRVNRPDGAYGLQLFLDVPIGWARHAGVPNRYIPAVAHVAWACPYGTLGNPENVAIGFPTYYPLNTAMDRVTIHLEPGVTGTYAWLLLP